MMHCKLFSIHAVAIFALISCCFQLLIAQCGGINLDANSTANSCSASSMSCANLGNITYPFWGSASCAASPSYVLSNCSQDDSPSSQAYWDSFSVAASGVIGPPAVATVESVSDMELSNPSVPEISIQISWNQSLNALGLCGPFFSSDNLSLYNIPSSINLSRFSDSSALSFSLNTTFLLFNCTRYNASHVDPQLGSQNFQLEGDVKGAGCKAIKGLCQNVATDPCIQWLLPPVKELMIQHALESFACSHFMLGALSDNTGIDSSKWSNGAIKLIWTDIQCKKCVDANGSCIFDENTPAKFNQCMCRNNIVLDVATQTSCNDAILANDGCHDGLLQCNTGAKVGVSVAIVVLVLGISIVMIGFKGNLSSVCGSIRDGMRRGFGSFTNVTIPIAINVLKTALRKLQSVSHGHNTSFDTIDFDGLTERPLEYSYGAMALATKSFSNLVGEGGFGSVYRGALTDAKSSLGSSGVQIAVKVLEVKSKYSRKQFLNEVVTIGRIHHVNVVRLLGFCMQEDHEMLVYEYVANGSLDRWLFADHRKQGQEQIMLNWGQRYAIALGVARGLSYLHEECRHRTVHCDIKPQNILLDENMQPKIADFGLARLMGRDESKVVTLAKGTPGYMAPEFWMGGESQLSTKFDVYSYGMVMLELISGRRNFRRGATLSGSGSFPAMAFKAAMQGDLESIVDSRLREKSKISVDDEEGELQWQQVRTAVLVALWCIQDHPAERPSMSEVVKYLEGGAAVSGCPPQPNISTFSVPRDTSPHEQSASSNHTDDLLSMSHVSCSS